MELLERFLKYVKIPTMSSEESNTIPSTIKQFDLASVLVDDLKELGLENIKLTDKCIVYAFLPSNANMTDMFIAVTDGLWRKEEKMS